MARRSLLASLEHHLLKILGPADVRGPGSQRPAPPSTEPTGEVIEGDFFRSDRAVEGAPGHPVETPGTHDDDGDDRARP